MHFAPQNEIIHYYISNMRTRMNSFWNKLYISHHQVNTVDKIILTEPCSMSSYSVHVYWNKTHESGI